MPGVLVWTGGVAVAVLVPDAVVRTMNDDLARLFLGDTASGVNRLRLGGMGRGYGFALSMLWILGLPGLTQAVWKKE